MWRAGRTLLATLVAALALSAVPFEAAAQMVRAYILIEVDASKADTAIPTLKSLSLMNCKMGAQVLMLAEVVAHLHCNDLTSLNKAVMEMALVDGVKRTTTLMVVNPA